MALEKTILPTRTADSYKIGPNEPLTTGSINRVLEHLLYNDSLLHEKIHSMGLSHAFQIWNQSSIYTPGDVVIYIQNNSENVQVFILLCISKVNKQPNYAIEQGRITFAASGWEVVHENTIYLKDDSFLKSNILEDAAKATISDHEKSLDYHHGTPINNLDDFSGVFLKKNLSNLSSPHIKRSNGEDSNSVSISSRATCSSMDNGIYEVVSSDKVVEMDIEFGFDSQVNQDIKILHPRYYLQEDSVTDKSDDHIFGSYYMEGTQDLRLKNGLVYNNLRIPGTNIFSHTIEFPQPFINCNYMLFPSSYLPNQFLFATEASQLVTAEEPTGTIFVSNILFVNKTASSVTAILPIHPHFGGYGKYKVGVPWINKFRVHVVGVVK